jgi:hypothetical protein
MERVEHRAEDELIELGVATVETKGGAVGSEFNGHIASYELSDQ